MTGTGKTLGIFVNDQPRSVGETATVPDLLGALGLAGREGLAVAINAAVVPRRAWNDRKLEEGDRVLIIQASQGG